MTSDSFRLDTVRIDDTGLAELDGERPIMEIAWQGLRALQLARGAGAERPWVVGTMGLALLLAGLYFRLGLLRFLAFGGRYHALGAWLIALGAVGAMMLWSLRPKYVLLATTASARRKLILQHCQDRAAIERFVAEATADRWPAR
jgi:hypothetical protein